LARARLIVELQRFELAGPEVLDRDIGTRSEAMQNLRTFRPRDVDARPPFVARHQFPPQRDAVLRGAEPAHIVALQRPDLD
jgi:hypothetical protein